MDFKIAVLTGDGIGPEITKQALKVLKGIAKRFNHNFDFKNGLVGGIAIDNFGVALPDETLSLCKSSDAVLLGAVGGQKWDTTEPDKPRPEQGLLGLRKELELFANVRPVKVNEATFNASPLKPEIIKGVDLVIVRELTGGMYFGKQIRTSTSATDTNKYQLEEISRIIGFACQMAQKRSKKLTSVDKANVLETSRLWREIAHQMQKSYPDLEIEDMLVDNCAMQLIKNPKRFDVIVMDNMFGDILSDESSMIAGSIGMLASGSFGAHKPAMFEPIHGSAPKMAGLDVANPLATILSLPMMFRHSFDLEAEAQAIEDAVDHALDKGYRTPDIMEDGFKKIGTEEMGNIVAQSL